MKRKLDGKKLGAALIFPLLMLAGTGILHPAQGILRAHAQDAAEKPQFVIIKFKDDGPTALGKPADDLFRTGKAFKSATANGSDHLDKLNRKWKVRNVKRLFKAHGKNEAETQRHLKKMKSRTTRRAPKDAKKMHLRNINLIEVPAGTDIEQLCKEYAPYSEYCTPRRKMKTRVEVKDPYFHSCDSWGQGCPDTGGIDDLWGIKRIKADQVWDITEGEGVIVAVIDTGVQDGHFELRDNMWKNEQDPIGDIPDECDRITYPEIDLADDDCNGYKDDQKGWDFSNDDFYPLDDNGHGTHVAGTIAALRNGAGIVGVAPKAQIMALKALDENGDSFNDITSEAIVYAVDAGARVINNSWGPSDRFPVDPLTQDAIDYAYSEGAVVVFAAGNESDNMFHFCTANVPEVLAVAATDSRDRRSDFSNFGPFNFLSAPGGEGGPGCSNFLIPSILSLRAHGTDMYAECGADWAGEMVVNEVYYRARGTSMATPHVAGAAALLLAAKPYLTNREVYQALLTSADDIGAPGYDIWTGTGRVNVLRAINEVETFLNVEITSPEMRAVVGSAQHEMMNITGTASGPEYAGYKVFLGTGLSPDQWDLIAEALTPVENNVLGTINIQELEEGYYVIRLVAQNTLGQEFQYVVPILVQEHPPRLISEASASFPSVAVFGDHIVWIDTRTGSYEVYLYDLNTDEIRPITSGSPDIDWKKKVDISGNYVVWNEWYELEDPPEGSSDRKGRIMLHDIKKGTTDVIVDNLFDSFYPSISGNRIAYQYYKDIFTCEYNAATGECPIEKITTDAEDPRYPTVNGDFIVWEEQGDVSPGIYFYDLKTGKIGGLGENPEKQVFAHIYKDHFVWRIKNDLYHCQYDRQTGECIKEKIVEAGFLSPDFPKIYKDTVIWNDYGIDPGRRGFQRVFTYDLKSGETARKTIVNSIRGNTSVWEHDIDFHDDKIVYIDQFVAGVRRGVYLIDLSPGDSDIREFRRGDSNGNGTVDLSDAIYTLNWLFIGGPKPECEDAADANDNGIIDLTDVIFMLNALFLGSEEIPAPGTTVPGVDTSDDYLECKRTVIEGTE